MEPYGLIINSISTLTLIGKEKNLSEEYLFNEKNTNGHDKLRVFPF